MNKKKNDQEDDASQVLPEAVGATEGRFGRQPERGTVPLFAIAGIRLRIHVVFLVIIAVLGFQAVMDGVWQHALYLPAVLLALTIHEMGHAFAARWLGQTSCKVIIHPLLSRPPVARVLNKPRVELMTALAGPLANAAVCLAVTIALFASGHLAKISLSPTALFSGGLMTRFFAFNLYMCGINLLPAFPLDGGRALRSALAIKWGDIQATRSVGATSLVGAFVFGIVGIHATNLFVSLFGLLLISGAIREIYESPILVAQNLELRMGDVIERGSVTLGPGMMVGEAARVALAHCQSQYPVVLGKSLLGVVARPQILRANPTAYVSGLMIRQVTCAKESDPLTAVLHRALPTYARPVVVTSTGTREGDFVGILCAESLQAWLILKASQLSRNNQVSNAQTEFDETATTFGLEGGKK